MRTSLPGGGYQVEFKQKEWMIGDEAKLDKIVDEFISIILNSRLGRDPEVIKLLKAFKQEKDTCKNMDILMEILKKI